MDGLLLLLMGSEGLYVWVYVFKLICLSTDSIWLRQKDSDWEI